MPSPFEEDRDVLEVALVHGLRLSARHDVIETTDALPDTYRCAKCKRVDYAKIRSHMAQGISVPGAIMTNRVEYVLSPKEDG
jgi:hypothetical protein